MEISRFLIISPGPKKWNPHVKLVTNLRGNMPSSSVAIKLNLNIPDAVFQKPQLEASIKIKEEDISKPIITAETLDNIKAVFTQQLGVDMSIQIVNKSKTKKT